MANDPSDWDLITPELIEQYKAWWKLHGFPDFDYSDNSHHKHGNDINDAGHQPIPEQWLWVGVLIEAIGDLNATSGYYDQPCIECHNNQPCGHVRDGRIHRKERRWGKDWNDCEYNHTYHECAVEWIAGEGCKEICDMLNIDHQYFQKQARLANA